MSLIAKIHGVSAEYRLRTNAILHVKSSWDYYGMSRPTWNEFQEGKSLRATVEGLPDVWRISPKDSRNKPDRIDLNEDRQHYLLKINLEAYRGYTVTKEEYFDWFQSGEGVGTMVNWLTSSLTYYRSHANDAGMDNCANFLTGERLDGGLPKFAQLVTGWYNAKPIFENGQWMKRNIVNVGVGYGFHCINASLNDHWNYSPLREWWLFDRPLSTGRTIIRDKAGSRIGRDDLHKPYPQFDGKLVFPVWLPRDSIAFIHTPLAEPRSGGNLNKHWIL